MNIVLIGHTYGIKNIIDVISKSNNYQVKCICTHEKHLHQYDINLFKLHEDKWGEFFFDVFTTKELYNIPVVEYQQINNEETINKIKSFQPDVIVTVGCRDILKKNFISSFPYLINLHPFNLPYWRGGGLDSWLILNGCWNTTQFVTSHFINEKIDAGEIIHKMPYFIKNKAYPIDIFKERITKLGELLLISLEKVKTGYKGEPQDLKDSRYYPKLNTFIDGKLNFNWDIAFIEKFVYAFSYPYPGCFLYYNDYKIHILEAEFTKEFVHPFSYGLIVQIIPDESFSFMANNGIIRVHKWYYTIDNKQVYNNTRIFKIGKRLK